jgi:hypothetical protein
MVVMSPSLARLALVSFAFFAIQCGNDEGAGECTTSRFASPLDGTGAHCVDISVSTLADGSSACRAFAASNHEVCDCSGTGRKTARQGACRLDLNVHGGQGPYSCVCELTQLSGVALEACLADDQDDSDGWCYAARSPACGPAASDEVTAACESGQRFKLQGHAALSSDETLLLICDTLSCE